VYPKHFVGQALRRAFLCGTDHYSGQCYEHRRQWVVDRIRLLSSLFAIDICSFAVLSNHYHLVLKICPDQIEDLTDLDIIDLWCSLFTGPILIQRHRQGEALNRAECDTVSDIVTIWRKRLASISWFMRCLNQSIARQANLEDHCTGKFWESRFHSLALKTEEALLSCMAYVDLNPIRSGIAEDPESSDYTSIQERIKPTFNLKDAIKSQLDTGDLIKFDQPIKPLLHFDQTIKNQKQTGIPFTYQDYLALVDWTGRAIRDDKVGFIDSTHPPILSRIDISVEQWLINTTQFETIHRIRFNRITPALDTG
jgi:REP element-mobilizing transposase RayT